MIADTPVFLILPASWRDLISVRHIEEICFGRDAWPLLDLIAVLTTPGVTRLKAMVGDSMAGFIAGDPRPREGLGWITTVGVLPEYRRKGIATALLDVCEQEMGLPRVRLCVRRTNYGAIKLYEERGYYQVGVWANYYSGGEDALVLEKKRQAEGNRTQKFENHL